MYRRRQRDPQFWALLALGVICLLVYVWYSDKDGAWSSLPLCSEPVSATPCRFETTFGRMVAYRSNGQVTAVPASRWEDPRDQSYADREPCAEYPVGGYSC